LDKSSLYNIPFVVPKSNKSDFLENSMHEIVSGIFFLVSEVLNKYSTVLDYSCYHKMLSYYLHS